MENETRMDRFGNFINRHKVAISVTVAVVATTAACIAMSRLADNGMREFLKEHNLWDEYISAIEE